MDVCTVDRLVRKIKKKKKRKQYVAMVKSMDSEVRWPGFRSLPCNLL